MGDRKRKMILILCAVLLIAAVLGCFRYRSEIDRIYTESTHQDVIRLTASKPEIGNTRVISAFYDRETEQYQFRVRLTGPNTGIWPFSGEHPVLEVNGQTIKAYSTIPDTLWFWKDYVLLFDGELADGTRMTVGTDSCVFSE